MYQKLITSMSALDLVKALYFMGGTSLVFHEIVYIWLGGWVAFCSFEHYFLVHICSTDDYVQVQFPR